MPSLPRALLLSLAVALAGGYRGVEAQTARISEETRVLQTYPFTEPNPVPILTRDARLYPYHSFLGYANEPTAREWKVVRLENDHIEVLVLPEVGGKVWGAVVKRSGHEFIYRNEVMKFRNIALRGPWTSGGIEFNFGVIGHTPATATPVDYVTRENPDGSVSCIVGAMDLPSRTHWRVEIRLPADRASFETRVLWYNPTPLEQPYYNWMTAAAFARDDLVMSIPGNAYLEHSGAERPWPVDDAGRFLPAYANNTFDGHKSYHVVGELDDFFGGYYRDEDYGFGHWSRYEEMPGQKLWLWALSRHGGVWEDLLTDTDGQYVEFQAGRLLVQYQPGALENPIRQAGFDPGSADRWSETWFPLEGIGGLTDASRDGAMHVEHADGKLTIRANAFLDAVDTLHVSWGDDSAVSIPLRLPVLESIERVIDVPAGVAYRVELPALGLRYASDSDGREVRRPFSTDPAARAEIPEIDRRVYEARELARGRNLREAREMLESALVEEPWNRDALLGLADLEYRRGRFEAGLAHIERGLQLDAYDAETNFIAGNLYRALGHRASAIEAYGWAARSMAFRSASYVQLAELMRVGGDRVEGERYARLAIDYDRYNLPARQVLAQIARERGDRALAAETRSDLLEIDPLHHFAAAEDYLTEPTATSAAALWGGLRGEYPEQVLLELAIDYRRRGASRDARALIELARRRSANPVLRAWGAWLAGDASALPGEIDPAFAFPFRRETIPVLEWAAAETDGWSWRYLLGLNLWARDREGEAAAQLGGLGARPDFAPAYATRGLLLARTEGRDPGPDLRRAVELGPDTRILHIHLVRHLQSRECWEEALEASAIARQRFPGDFDLDLLHVGSLNRLGRAPEAIEILDATRVLPSENAGESHRLHERAHTLAALDALESGDDPRARDHLRRALEWPEHLGQGRPYEPEERLVQYLLGRAEHRLGDEAAARAAFETVISGTRSREAAPSRLDLLAIPAALALGGPEIAALDRIPDSDSRRAAVTFAAEVGRGEPLGPAVARLAAGAPTLFDGFDGGLLRRALSIAP